MSSAVRRHLALAAVHANGVLKPSDDIESADAIEVAMYYMAVHVYAYGSPEVMNN